MQSHIYSPWLSLWCHCLKMAIPFQRVITVLHSAALAQTSHPDSCDSCAWAGCVMKETKQNSVEKGVRSLAFRCSFMSFGNKSARGCWGLCVQKHCLQLSCVCHNKSFKKQLSIGPGGQWDFGLVLHTHPQCWQHFAVECWSNHF